MNREKWQRVRSVFDDVVESGVEERTRALAAEPPEIRKEVEALLESHDAIVDQRIEPGTVIDKYEIVRMLGDGGMGSVYLARQRAPIQREVALKVIRDGWVTADLLQRFQAERQVLATLNHPNISAVLDAGATKSRRHYFVMEYVDGVPITDYCRDRRLGRSERLELMDRVFDAIQHAHAKGVVHRDLKPTNVLVAEQGGKAVPKVIDFGIAKSIDAEATPHTVTGQLLGTPAYMSPEQARGRTVDSRTDLWALGCLLYEIETGQPTFPCENLGDTIVAILSTEPDMSLLPADTPAALRRLLRRCLAKDPELRQASAADARLDLVESREGALDAERPGRRGRWTAIAWVAAILLAIAGFWSRGDTRSASRPPRKLQVVATGVSRHERAAPVLAPDGRAFAHVREGKLWVRRLDSLDAFLIAGTDGAAYPFWSPDSRSLGYFAGGSICRVPVGGGEITKVFQLRGDIVGGAGAVWTRDDEIYYGRGNTALYVIPARGGERRTAYDPPKAHVHGPAALPNGGVFFVVHGTHAPNRIAALVDGDCNLVLDVGDQRIGGIAWSPTGHMVMARGPVDAGIWAVPYSVETATIGKSFRVAPDGGRPSVADDGSLLYVPAIYAERMQLGWVARDGKWVGDVGSPAGQFRYPRLSPDGTRVAVTQRTVNSYDVWIHDLAAGTSSRLTFDATFASWAPRWTPDGEWIVGHKNTTDLEARVDPRLWIRRADGSGKARSLGGGWLPDVSRDGKYVVFGTMDPNIAFTDVHDPTKRRVLVGGAADVREPAFSPDGKLVAYTSNENGIWEVVVTRFPSGDGKWQVTRGGGTDAHWNADGSRIAFVHGNSIYEVDVFRDPIRASPPRLVFKGDPLDLILGQGFDPSGDRFLAIREVRANRNEEAVVLVDDWVTAAASR